MSITEITITFYDTVPERNIMLMTIRFVNSLEIVAIDGTFAYYVKRFERQIVSIKKHVWR